jgi:phosphoribosyl-dephospho-CoA transferase
VLERLRRHDLLSVHPDAWQRVMRQHPDLASRPHVAEWAERGWPVVVRRYQPWDAPEKIPVAISLPPVAGKSGFSLQIETADVREALSSVTLSDCVAITPSAWRETVQSLCGLRQRFDTEPRVYGSLRWQTLTGLTYLNDRSDLDLLWSVTRYSQAIGLANALSLSARQAPMRLDGEFILPQGEAVHWREFYDGADEVIVKTAHQVESRSFRRLFDPRD